MNNKILFWSIVIIVVLAFIILPTFTPEDLVTTIPILGSVGLKKFLIIAGITLIVFLFALLIAYNNKPIKDFLKQKQII